MRSASDSKFEVGSYHLGMGLIMHIHLHFLCISWLGEWQNMGHKQPTRCHKEFCCFTFWVLFGHPSSTTLLGNEITVLFPYSRWDFAWNSIYRLALDSFCSFFFFFRATSTNMFLMYLWSRFWCWILWFNFGLGYCDKRKKHAHTFHWPSFCNPFVILTYYNPGGRSFCSGFIDSLWPSLRENFSFVDSCWAFWSFSCIPKSFTIRAKFWSNISIFISKVANFASTTSFGWPRTRKT